MKVYQFPFSPNCQKVVAIAHEVGMPLELAMVDLFKGEARSPVMRAKNPNGKLPILEDGDLVLWESTAMLAYIAAKAGREDLAPTTPGSARMSTAGRRGRAHTSGPRSARSPSSAS